MAGWRMIYCAVEFWLPEGDPEVTDSHRTGVPAVQPALSEMLS